MKGQFFLISGVILVIVLFLIKSSLNLNQIIESKRSLEVAMEKKEFLNIKEQAYRTIEYSYNKNESEKIENYLKYVRERVKSRALEFEGMVIVIVYKNVTAGSEKNLSITVFNFLGETITTLNLSFNNSFQSFSNLADESSLQTRFSFTTDSDCNHTLITSYSTSKETRRYSIPISLELNKSKLVVFFSLKLAGLRSENKDEFLKIVDIN